MLQVCVYHGGVLRERRGVLRAPLSAPEGRRRLGAPGGLLGLPGGHRPRGPPRDGSGSHRPHGCGEASPGRGVPALPLLRLGRAAGQQALLGVQQVRGEFRPPLPLAEHLHRETELHLLLCRHLVLLAHARLGHQQCCPRHGRTHGRCRRTEDASQRALRPDIGWLGRRRGVGCRCVVVGRDPGRLSHVSVPHALDHLRIPHREGLQAQGAAAGAGPGARRGGPSRPEPAPAEAARSPTVRSHYSAKSISTVGSVFRSLVAEDGDAELRQEVSAFLFGPPSRASDPGRPADCESSSSGSTQSATRDGPSPRAAECTSRPRGSARSPAEQGSSIDVEGRTATL